MRWLKIAKRGDKLMLVRKLERAALSLSARINASPEWILKLPLDRFYRYLTWTFKNDSRE
jgi:hypothetical protein